MMNAMTSLFKKIISVEQLFDAWDLFKKGKRGRKDVREFERHLEKNIFKLHRELISKQYKHSSYSSFFIHDPKIRHIRKACVRDRLVHQAVYTALVEIYEPLFIHHLYSSRLGKGTHKGVKALEKMTFKVSKNYTRTCWSLKCDVRRFFDTVDHEILLNVISAKIKCTDTIWLIKEIVHSFHCEGTPGKGLPIGNLSSQIFTNIYLNEFDQFMEHTLRERYYLRFADDFLTLSPRKHDLHELLPKIESFLSDQLKLELHPSKVVLRPLHQGIDFLGYVNLPYHRVLRTKTKQRMKRKLDERLDSFFEGEIDRYSMNQSLQSYLGVLSHADTHKLEQEIKNKYYWG